MKESTWERNLGNATNVREASNIETDGRLMYKNAQEMSLHQAKDTGSSNACSVTKYSRKLGDLNNIHNPGTRVMKNQKPHQDQYNMPNAMKSVEAVQEINKQEINEAILQRKEAKEMNKHEIKLWKGEEKQQREHEMYELENTHIGDKTIIKELDQIKYKKSRNNI